MLQLLSPLALFGLAALAIPAILHLWRPPPRTVRLGTLRFFTGPAVRRLTKLRWRERLLLAVRLLLLVLLALLLAQPIWRKPAPTQPQRWALLEPGVLLRGDALERWRQLDRDGFETRELGRGFGRTRPATDATNQLSEPPDVWSLLREVDARVPAGSTIAVFATNRIPRLRGERPAMQHCTVEWIEAAPDEAERAVWISSARASKRASDAAREVRVIVATSTAAGLQRVAVSLPAAPGTTVLPEPLSAYRVEVALTDDAKLSVRVTGGTTGAGEWLSIADERPLRVAVLHDAERSEDARFVRAALVAAAEASRREITFDPDIRGADWIVWLNDQAPPPEVLNEVTNRGTTLLSDAENSRAARISTVTSIAAPALPEAIPLFHRVAPSPDPGVAIWSDAFGTPLLSMKQEGRGRSFRFFSRFHPDWNDLPQSSALAAALRSLFFDTHREAQGTRSQDLRRADPTQGPPAQPASAEAAAEVRLATSGEIVDLHRTLWVLCLLLFALERLLSHRTTRSPRTAVVQQETKEEPALAAHA